MSRIMISTILLIVNLNQLKVNCQNKFDMLYMLIYMCGGLKYGLF
jgi:hypothetical protein